MSKLKVKAPSKAELQKQVQEMKKYIQGEKEQNEILISLLNSKKEQNNKLLEEMITQKDMIERIEEVRQSYKEQMEYYKKQINHLKRNSTIDKEISQYLNSQLLNNNVITPRDLNRKFGIGMKYAISTISDYIFVTRADIKHFDLNVR